MLWKGDRPRRPVLRGDYKPPPWLVDHVDLDIRLDPDDTRVIANLAVRRNPAAAEPRAPLSLHGAGLETRAIAVDGRPVAEKDRRLDGETLIIGRVPDQARITTEVRIRPAANTALEGLYQSGSSLLTQCEAEGFRKLTWFPDRPDVMSAYRVRLEADAGRYPVLLGNGNLVAAGRLEHGRHFAVWDDPFPKPSYLFAVVAGDLGCLEDEFITASGRKVALKIYSERDNLSHLGHAMASLEKAMRWDEERFGLEYDLDVYHIVATHDFNMGAMENKSLNIFNARYVLADPETATDADYLGIEAVIAHEYFHNWTGNRVTCRDWFQLTLKEGLTVFRDQEFTADQQSAAVKRIEDVRDLMERQFPEDAGPMAHPVRPERYIEINNFYTATVYEKGAEVVRMYQTLLGRDGFCKGMELYFRRHDGGAVTCDDFRAAMADANGADLEQFGRWYRQVGTPRVAAAAAWDEASRGFVLEFTQQLPTHADNARLGPLQIPVSVGLLDGDGSPLPVTLKGENRPGPETRTLVVDETRKSFRFSGLEAPPLVSLLRGFSAPVQLEFGWSEDELSTLLARDPDPVARWLAGRRLARGVLDRAISGQDPGGHKQSPELLVSAWHAVLTDDQLDPGLAAELLQLPSETELAQNRDPVDVEAIHAARKAALEHLAAALESRLRECYRQFHDRKPWQFSPVSVGRRRLKNACLRLLCAGRLAQGDELAWDQFETADNMTDRLAALSALVHSGAQPGARALAAFAERHAGNPLVMDKWFAVQAARPHPDTADAVRALANHPAFSLKNPNKVRALVGTFGLRNPAAFHRADGAGYRFYAGIIRELDGVNPQVAARLAAAFSRWRAYPKARAALMEAELKALKSKPSLSPDVDEIISAALRPVR